MSSSPQPVMPLLRPGNEINLRVVAFLPPGAPAPPPAPGQIAATVISTNDSGSAVLQAGDMTLFVKAPAALPPGSSVIVTLEPLKQADLVTLPVTQPQSFAALPQALDALAQFAPQVLQQALAAHIPQPTEALPGALMLLFGAFKGGNLRGWLGDAPVETLLRAGKSDIVASLTRNLAEAGQSAQDAVVGEWRSFPIPLLAQQQFQALNLYVHSEANRDGAAATGGEAAKKTRFLIDMRLSRLGALQIDGFVHSKKLDMILRSETGLPPGLHHELRGAYTNAIEAVGYKGTLNFQVGRRFWMAMQQQAATGVFT